MLVSSDGMTPGILHAQTINDITQGMLFNVQKRILANEYEATVENLGEIEYFEDSDPVVYTTEIATEEETEEVLQYPETLTITGYIRKGEVPGHTATDNTPIKILVYDGEWNLLEEYITENNQGYEITTNVSDVVNIKFECDGYLPMYLREFGTGAYLLGSGESEDTITLIPGDTKYNKDTENSWSDDRLDENDALFVESCLGAKLFESTDFNFTMDLDDDGLITQEELASFCELYNNDLNVDVSSVNQYDVNDDGVINTYDYSLLERAVYKEEDNEIVNVSDFTGDGAFTGDDLEPYLNFMYSSDEVYLYNHDINHDGILNNDDYIPDLIDYYASLRLSSENYFSYMDKNSNYEIDESDLEWFKAAFEQNGFCDTYKRTITMFDNGYFKRNLDLYDTNLDLNGCALHVDGDMNFHTQKQKFWEDGNGAYLNINGGYLEIENCFRFRTTTPDGWNEGVTPGQEMNLNNGGVVINGQFDFGQPGCYDTIIMDDPDDTLIVNGDWRYVTATDMEGKWVSGIIYFLGKEWTVNEKSGDKSIYSSGEHQIYFFNPEGLQTILWDNPNEYITDDGFSPKGRRFNFDYVDEEGNCLGVILPYGFSSDLYWFRPWFKINEEDYTLYREGWDIGDGVHAATGNFNKSFMDYSVVSPGITTDFVRTYNSTSTEEGSFGEGWDFNLDVSRINAYDYNGYYQVVLPDGSNTTFELKANGEFKCLNAHSKLERKSCGNGKYEYTLTNSMQEKYHFNVDGELDKITDAKGNVLEISSIEDGKRTVTDSIGRKYIIYYNNDTKHRRITKIEDVVSQKVIEYEYDADNRLISASNPKGGKEHYRYDENGKLCEILNAFNETTCTVSYADAGKVDYLINEAGLKQVYTYSPDNRQTGLKEYDGDRLIKTVTYEYDNQYAIVGNTVQADNIQYTDRTSYNQVDGKNRYDEVERTVDAAGTTTRYEYDDRGNAIKVINHDDSYTLTRYNENNMPVVEVNETKYVTIYEYDDAGINVKKEYVSFYPVNNADDIAKNDFDLSVLDYTDYAMTVYEYCDIHTDNGTDVIGLVRSITDPEGNTTINSYNDKALLEKQALTDKNGNIVHEILYTYNKDLQVTRAEESVDLEKGIYSVTEYEYDELNNITVVRDYGTSDTPYEAYVEYDVLGRKTAEYQPKYSADKSVKTTYTYTSANYPETITDALGNTTSYEYDVYGNAVTVVNPDGSINSSEYDAFGREIASYFAESAGSTKQILAKYKYEYTWERNDIYTSLDEYETKYFPGLKETAISYITADKQVTTETQQDFRGNTLYEKINGKLKRSSSYYKDGSLARQTDALGNTTKYEYGYLGLLEKTYVPFNKDAEGTVKYVVSENEYDKNGNVIKSIYPVQEQDSKNAEYRISKNEYDAAGNLIKTTLANSENGKENITKYEYNNIGNVIKMYTGLSSESDDEYLLTEYFYDEHQRLIKTSDSTGYVSGETEYDANGNVIRSEDANGNETTTEYDVLDRVVKTVTVHPEDAEKNVTSTYKYDVMGRITTATVNGVTTAYKYDKLGRVISESEYGKDNSTFKGYFYEGISSYISRHVTGIENLLIYSDMTYEYDDEMRVIKISEAEKETVSYEYDANGNKAKEKLANGVETSYTYNCADAITEIVSTKNNEKVSSYSYTYYTDGSEACKVSEENGIIETVRYDYNEFGQLSTEERTVGSLTDKYTYTYDDYGNRTKMTATGTEVFTTVYNYNNKSGKYTSLLQSESKKFINEHTGKEETSITAYEYDKNGSQLVKTNNEKTERNTYDSTGQLISYTDGETTASYTYDVNGLRKSKTVDGETITHIWNGNGQIIADVTEGKYYQADCYVQSTGITAKYSFTNGRKTAYEYYLKNAHGDVVGITDDTGAVKKIYRYDAFGVEKNKDESDTNAFRYCGEYYDKESDTIYLRARYYSPTTGRFISRDSDPGTSADPLSLNLYTYCHNNPVLYTDPSGHSIKKWFKDRVDDWKVGISMLKDMGGAGEVFASYSEGVVDSLGSTVSAVAHPVKTAKEMGAGVKAIASDPTGAASQFAASVKSTISDVGKGDFNSVAYMLGGLSVDAISGGATKAAGRAATNVVNGAVAKIATSKIGNKISSAKCTILNKGCFVAGTLVLTIDGHKPIETIEAGDFVLSSDPETGEVAYKEVLQTYVFIKDALVYVTINGEVIETTKEHPFWIEGQGWTKAEFLKAGDIVRSEDGSGIEIEDVEIFELPEDEYVVVYNFEVADFHSYYVSEFNVLVHNTCPGEDLIYEAKRNFDFDKNSNTNKHGTIIVSDSTITEGDAIKILSNPNAREGIYTKRVGYAEELARKASNMKTPIAHTHENQLRNNCQSAHYHAVLPDGNQGHAHAWFGKIRGEGGKKTKKK